MTKKKNIIPNKSGRMTVSPCNCHTNQLSGIKRFVDKKKMRALTFFSDVRESKVSLVLNVPE